MGKISSFKKREENVFEWKRLFKVKLNDLWVIILKRWIYSAKIILEEESRVKHGKGTLNVWVTLSDH